MLKNFLLKNDFLSIDNKIRAIIKWVQSFISRFYLFSFRWVTDFVESFRQDVGITNSYYK